jgi:nucleotide-binding universal stress UspA family protein
MEDKLVTLAIRTYQRALMIQSVLQENNIETLIHNLNLEHPELAVGVRVRIKESDLPQALKIVEEVEKEWEKENDKPAQKQILIAYDFNDPIDKTIDLGFQFADNLNAEVVILYAYFSPAFTISVHNDVSTYSIRDSELLRRIVSNTNADVNNMTNLINSRINNKELPNVAFSFDIKEGVPEDEILDYCKKYKPDLVVMGTQGKKYSTELIGSVTAEVIESSEVPVFAVPRNITYENSSEIKRIAFLTNFDQKDLIAIDKTISIFSKRDLEIHFIHASEKDETWSEVVLTGIKTYFENHYPKLNTKYELIGSTNTPELIENYLQKHNIDLLALNIRRRKLFSRLFNPGLAYKMVLKTDTAMFVTHI